MTMKAEQAEDDPSLANGNGMAHGMSPKAIAISSPSVARAEARLTFQRHAPRPHRRRLTTAREEAAHAPRACADALGGLGGGTHERCGIASIARSRCAASAASTVSNQT